MANYVKLNSLNDLFQCSICYGYIIDATTITECLHSFCKSCIYHYIESINQRCPTCDQSLEDIDNCIAPDPSLQRLIYQLIPNLLTNELERREQFHESTESLTILTENTLVNLKLCNNQQSKRQKNATKNNNNSILMNKEIDSTETTPINEPAAEVIQAKYIQCIALTPIRIIARMIRNKYNIPENYGIKIFHMGHQIRGKETLLQIYTSFIKSKTDVLELNYELVKRKHRPSDLALENQKLIKSMSEALDFEDSKKKIDSSLNTTKHAAKGKKIATFLNKCSKSKKSLEEKLESKEKNNNSTQDGSKKTKTLQEKEPIAIPPIESSIKRLADLNDSESVYYSDYDDDNSSEGKLLIADDDSNEEIKKSNPNDRKLVDGNKNSGKLNESSLDLRVQK